MNDTLRGNILFGRRCNKERYEKVIEACALLDDLAVLPAGDKTEIGEKGINLSGGQKARVSLARAMYSEETKLLLLDDPLSAVDAHVGEHLFRRAITGEVSAGTTRLFVTHHVHFLPRCDKVIVLEGGRIKHYGKYSDLIDLGVDFAGSVDVTKGDLSLKLVVFPCVGESKRCSLTKTRTAICAGDGEAYAKSLASTKHSIRPLGTNTSQTNTYPSTEKITCALHVPFGFMRMRKRVESTKRCRQRGV